jgi:hypothetical protein
VVSLPESSGGYQPFKNFLNESNLELVNMTLQLMGKRRLLVPIPFAVAEVQARLFELLPNPPLTTGQVDLLKTDNVASGALPDVQDLGIQPKTVEEIIPTYIGPRAPGPR